ncbi:hypothetical protein ACVBEJ_03320 [Porticoccus sp. GXU_MW_L64]
MKNIYTLATLLVIGAVFWVSYQDDTVPPLAFTVCSDGKVYVVDLKKGMVSHISKKIPDIGGASQIDIDSERSLLYISSDRSISGEPFIPLLSLDIRNFGFETKSRFFIDETKGLSELKIEDIDEVYSFRLSDDGEKIFVGNNINSKLFSVVDRQSGKVVAGTDTSISQKNFFSPDSKSIASIWTSGKKRIPSATGFTIKEWKGGVVVQDIYSGEILFKKELEGNKGMYPPWREGIPKRHYQVVNNQFLEVYDRESGVKESRIDLVQLSGMKPNVGVTQDMTPVYGAKKLILPMTNKDKSYVVSVDTKRERMEFLVEVGPSPCTNVEVLKK